MKRPLRWALLSLLTVWGCSDARLGNSTSEGQTKIRVSPRAFVGDVPCVSGAAGSLIHYVVRLQEVDGAFAGDAGLAPITSPPVPCARSVTFAAIPGRRYAADILGFDRPIEAEDVGNVEPRWTASCGRGDPNTAADAGVDLFAPTVAVRGFIIPLRGCTSFGGPASSSRLVVDVAGALGDLRCGSQPGEVSSIEAALEGSRQIVACGEPIVFPIATPGRAHEVELVGYELATDAGSPAGPEAGLPTTPTPDAGSTDAGPLLDAAAPDAADAGQNPNSEDASVAPTDGGQEPAPLGQPRWRTRCTGRSLPGVSQTAACEPFARLAP